MRRRSHVLDSFSFPRKNTNFSQANRASSEFLSFCVIGITGPWTSYENRGSAKRLFVTANKKPFHGISSDYFAGWTGVGPLSISLRNTISALAQLLSFSCFRGLCSMFFPLPRLAVIPFSFTRRSKNSVLRDLLIKINKVNDKIYFTILFEL